MSGGSLPRPGSSSIRPPRGPVEALGFSPASRLFAGPRASALGKCKLQTKSLRINILLATPLDGIFCNEMFSLALCFQYFAAGVGGGDGAVVSSQLSVLSFC